MNYFLISGIVAFVTLIICLVLIFRGRWIQRRRPIENYEEGRNKLTFRKKKEKPKEENIGFGFSALTSLIGAFIIILIGVNLAPVITEQLGQACNQPNISNLTVGINTVLGCGSDGSNGMFSLITLFFVLTIAIAAISMTLNSLKGVGLA